MKSIAKNVLRIILSTFIFLFANLYTIKNIFDIPFFVLLIVFLLINIIPSFFNLKLREKSLKTSANGCELLSIFLISTFISIIYSVLGYLGILPMGSLIEEPKLWLGNTLMIFLVEMIVFWNGLIKVYISSKQLGMKYRIIGAVCGLIPIVNLIVLCKIIKIVSKEVKNENDKLILNEKRKHLEICKTKFPILMVHGVFFRDFRYFNYWGRIPKELEKNGAIVYYGNQQSADSVENCAKELTERIKDVLKETGAEKVNIIAHSKGGLDSRYALSMFGMAPFVASLTTINTPHRGCEFADYLLKKIPKAQQKIVADTYNKALSKLGDHNPDFMAAITDLTASACNKRNEIVLDADGVKYQSVGSKLNFAESGRFPLNFSYRLVKYFDGANDGLVGEESFEWGENYRFLTTQGNRGISHGDMIDLNRENFDGFDVREFYVQLVADLKNKGF